MNKIESLVYSIAYKHPSFKLFLRNTYQTLFDLLPRSAEKLPDGLIQLKGCFFGFHDLPQISPDDSKILVIKNHFDGRMPNKGETAEIGYYDLSQNGEVGSYHYLAETSSWNFHKGCREQWINNGQIIFNTYENKRLISRIISISNSESESYDFPIDTVDCRYRLATTFSFARLQRCMPGYGYPYEDDLSFIEEDAPAGTGLFIADLENGELTLAVSLKELASSAPAEFSNGYIHFVTHSEFSPDGKYISFLHRWIKKGTSTNKRWTRLMVLDLESGELKEMPSQLCVSHYIWNNNKQIIASSVIDGSCSHVLYDICSGKSFRKILPEQLNSDGHQTLLRENEFITDTYPDRRRMSRIFRVNVELGSCECLAALYSPSNFQTKKSNCHIACDLHPRMSLSGRYLTFDSPRDGIRSTYILKVK